ncbi:MAG: hypothetical protein ACYCVB_02620 [Bacilli bacterium]
MAARYDHLAREELQSILVKRGAERKLGLVWERNELEREAGGNRDFIVADLDRNLAVGEATFRNLLIEGDNKDALRFLNLAFRGRIQCIYTDPPASSQINHLWKFKISEIDEWIRSRSAVKNKSPEEV